MLVVKKKRCRMNDAHKCTKLGEAVDVPQVGACIIATKGGLRNRGEPGPAVPIPRKLQPALRKTGAIPGGKRLSGRESWAWFGLSPGCCFTGFRRPRLLGPNRRKS